MRADAERNKKLIVQAAREVFATAGLAASIDEIAQRAGVGTGTLYRHFPTKEALFEAIVIGRVEELVEEARRLVAGSDPKTAFFELLSHVQALVSAACTVLDRQDGGDGLERVVWTVISDGLRPKEAKHEGV